MLWLQLPPLYLFLNSVLGFLWWPVCVPYDLIGQFMTFLTALYRLGLLYITSIIFNWVLKQNLLVPKVIRVFWEIVILTEYRVIKKYLVLTIIQYVYQNSMNMSRLMVVYKLNFSKNIFLYALSASVFKPRTCSHICVLRDNLTNKWDQPLEYRLVTKKRSYAFTQKLLTIK